MKIDNLTLVRDSLKIEWEQLDDEGRDVSLLEEKYRALIALPDEVLEADQECPGKFLDHAALLDMRPGYEFREPSGLEEIRSLRPAEGGKTYAPPSESEFADRLHGAWLGRAAGCLLGKPVEGWKRGQIEGYLRDLDRFPLEDYFRADIPSEIAARYPIEPQRGFIDRVERMPWDDDLNYTLLALILMKKHGAGFTPADVARLWLENLPLLSTWTAERTAYRNFLLGFDPPESAFHRNPYREWIGAQIRADHYGWVAPGNPQLAAEWAWRDASVSHVKNGIYGAMWAAAMLASAPCVGSPEEALFAGMNEIPAGCRLAAALHEVSGWHKAGLGYDEAVNRIHARWDDGNPHHWCHTISNAQVVALGLLWGGGDFGLSICRAVQPGFDTDCNGATVGSVLGMILGAEALPEKWTGPLGGCFESSIPGYQVVDIGDVARESLTLWGSLRN